MNRAFKFPSTYTLLSNFISVNSDIRKIPVVFLTGSSRSGTTLLSNILHSHPKITSCPENGFITSHIHTYGKRNRFSASDAHEFLKFLWVRKRLMKHVWNLDMEKLRNSFEQADQLDFRLAARLIYQQYAPAKAPDTYIDKGPAYLRNTKALDRVFHDPKYLIIVRDYRDRYASLKRLKKFSPFKFMMVRGVSWIGHQKKALKLKEQYPQRVHLLTYENLLNHPTDELNKVCRFLGVQFSDHLLEHPQHIDTKYETKAKGKHKEHFTNSHAKSLQRIDPSNTSKYRDLLNPLEIGLLDYACREIGSRFGYSPDPIGTSPRLGRKFTMRIRILFASFGQYPLRLFFRLPLKLQAFIINTAHRFLYSG